MRFLLLAANTSLIMDTSLLTREFIVLGMTFQYWMAIVVVIISFWIVLASKM